VNHPYDRSQACIQSGERSSTRKLSTRISARLGARNGAMAPMTAEHRYWYWCWYWLLVPCTPYEQHGATLSSWCLPLLQERALLPHLPSPPLGYASNPMRPSLFLAPIHVHVHVHAAARAPSTDRSRCLRSSASGSIDGSLHSDGQWVSSVASCSLSAAITASPRLNGPFSNMWAVKCPMTAFAGTRTAGGQSA